MGDSRRRAQLGGQGDGGTLLAAWPERVCGPRRAAPTPRPSPKLAGPQEPVTRFGVVGVALAGGGTLGRDALRRSPRLGLGRWRGLGRPS